MKSENKTKAKVKITPAKSVIRWAWVRMKNEGAVKLADKKRIFTEVINESKIQSWAKERMISNANRLMSHKAFDQYLINSKACFERNYVTVTTEE